MNPTQTRRLAQEAQDTYRRALVGGIFYLVAWLVVGWYADAFVRAPEASVLLALAFFVLAVARFVRRPPAGEDTVLLLRWLRMHWGIVLAVAVLWSGVFAWAVLDPDFANARTAALLSTIGLATAFALTFSMRRTPALVGVAVLYLPGLVLMFFASNDRASAWVMLVYLVYVLLALLRSHAEYQERLDLDQELRDQRDLFARLSRIDALTELANRRHFGHALDQAIETSRAGRHPLALLVLDLDHFKRINDEHGHAVGDACLIAFASRLASAFSVTGELPARLGGEEFAVVLEGSDAAMARERAESFRARLAIQPIELDGGHLRLTVSIGVAAFDAEMHRDGDGLYRAADRAVYRAKSEGRNRVSVESRPLRTPSAPATQR